VGGIMPLLIQKKLQGARYDGLGSNRDIFSCGLAEEALIPVDVSFY